MKSLPLAALAAALLLAGCASSGPATTSADNSASWYNPISWHWSALNPLGWFGSSLSVSEQGVGGISGATAMNEQALSEGLNGDYRLRKGMRSENGNVVSFWQALDDKTVKLEINGQSTVERVVVSDENITGPDGVKLGSAFSDLYSKAFGVCKNAGAGQGSDISCQAPGSQHIWYQFSGEWHGPEGLMPDDATLKSWHLTRIIWQR